MHSTNYGIEYFVHKFNLDHGHQKKTEFGNLTNFLPSVTYVMLST